MPLGVKPMCTTCKTTVSKMWRKDDNHGFIVCNSCYISQSSAIAKEDNYSVNSDNDSTHSGSLNGSVRGSTVPKNNETSLSSKDSSTVRKSLRIKPSSKSKNQPSKGQTSKGKGRRTLLKRNPIKAHTAVATIVTRDSFFHEGVYYQTGDIVSLVDHSGEIYYAQITGLLQDQYCEKSVMITWLIPTLSSPTTRFEPSTYILGPTEELPRKIECIEFVCHAPSGYFKDRTAHPISRAKPDYGFIWTHIGPQVCKLPTTDEIFGTNITDFNFSSSSS